MADGIYNGIFTLNRATFSHFPAKKENIFRRLYSDYESYCSHLIEIIASWIRWRTNSFFFFFLRPTLFLKWNYSIDVSTYVYGNYCSNSFFETLAIGWMRKMLCNCKNYEIKLNLHGTLNFFRFRKDVELSEEYNSRTMLPKPKPVCPFSTFIVSPNTIFAHQLFVMKRKKWPRNYLQ